MKIDSERQTYIESLLGTSTDLPVDDIIEVLNELYVL